MSFLGRLSIAHKLGLLIGIAISICAMAISFSTSTLLKSELTTLTVETQQKSMRTAALGFQKTFPNFTYKITANGDVVDLRIPSIPDFHNHSMIDSIATTTGDTATIFRWDDKTQDFWRKTTNIKKADGSRAIGTQLGQKGRVYPVVTAGRTYRGEAVILGIPYYTEYAPIKNSANKVIGILYVGIAKETSEHLYNDIMDSITVVSSGVFIVLLGLTLWLGKIGVRPIESLIQTMEELSSGNLDAQIHFDDQQDEIGDMARAVRVFKNNALQMHEMEKRQKEQERKAAEQRKADMLSLANEFESDVGQIIEHVSAAVTQLNASSGQMSEIASKTESQAMSVATASEQASANVQTVATATEELSSSISEIGQQVQHSTSVSEQAVNSAFQTTQSIQELASIADQIGNVVNMINDIANQTNLLALNATIEAARAGDAGKGFAVVAEEVKNLATQTARATGEIGEQINKVQLGTNQAVTAIDGISEIIGNMSEVSSAIAAAVEEQGAATMEIARNVEMAAVGTTEVSSNIGLVQQAAETTGHAAEQIHQAAGELSEQSERLRTQVDDFIYKIREDAHK